jgi:hypothetical protein
MLLTACDRGRLAWQAYGGGIDVCQAYTLQ